MDNLLRYCLTPNNAVSPLFAILFGIGRDSGITTYVNLSPASRTKKEGHPYGCPSFLVQALLLRKSACLRAGDLTRKGNPTKVSLAHIPFLATYRSAHGQQNLWAVTKRQTSIRMSAVFDAPLLRRSADKRHFCAIFIIFSSAALASFMDERVIMLHI